MNNKLYNKAESLFYLGDYKSAFNLYRSIAENTSINAEDRSDSYNMMGAIVLFDPTIDLEDESGINHFLKALEINPNNIGALFNIIENFGISVNNHRNSNAVISAIKQLNYLEYKLTTEEEKMINKKLDELKKISRESL